jgi:hypothetical protein
MYAEKYFEGLGKLGVEFLTDFSKKSKKGGQTSQGLVFHKII